MPVDRGGLDYTIEVKDKFSTTTDAFVDRIDKMRASFDRFRADMAKGINVKPFTDAERATRRAAASERDLAQERQKGTRTLSIKEQAERKHAKAVRDAAVSREQARINEGQNFALDKKALTVQQARRKAEQDIARVTSRRLVLQQRMLIVQQRNVQLTEREAVALGLASKATTKLSDEQARLARAKERLARASANFNNDELLKLDAQRRAIEQITKERLKQLTNEELARRGFTPRGGAVAAPEQSPAERNKTLSFFDRLGAQLDKTETRGNRIAFTFRRLFGILAAFAAARAIVGFFRDLVSETIRLNAQLETVELGIATIIASVATIRNLDGSIANAEQRLSIAMTEARKQTQLLRLDALETTATFEDLANTFQLALAPGLRAGLDIDQVREFSRQISIAATALGLEQRQLAEETRSLLTATIRPQNTRIATFLGITNADIRNAQRAGNLFEFLEERFSAFDAAGKRAARTFSGVVARVKDGLQILIQSGGIQFFESLKTLLEDIFDDLVEVDDITGRLKPNEGLVRVVGIIAEGLTLAVRQVERLRDVLTVEDFAAIAAGFRALSTVVSRVFSGSIEGIVLGLADASRILISIGNIINRITGNEFFTNEAVGEIATIIVRILTVLVVLSLTISAIALAVKGIAFLLGGIVTGLKVAHATIKGIRTAILGCQAAMILLGKAGIPFLATMVAALAAAAALSLVIAQLTGVLNLEDTAVGVEGGRVISLMERLPQALAVLDPTATDAQRAERGLALAEDVRRVEEFYKDARENQQSFEDAFNSSWDKIKGEVGGIVDDLIGDVTSLEESMRQAFDNDINGLIFGTSDALQQLRQGLIDLQKEVRDAQSAVEISRSIRGLEQSTSDIVRAREDIRIRALEEARDLEREIGETKLQVALTEQRIAAAIAAEQGDEVERLQGLKMALEGLLASLEQGRDALELNLTGISTANALAAAETRNFEQSRELVLLRIQAVMASNIALAERERDIRKIAAAELGGELELLNAAERQRTETLRRSVDAIREEIRLAEQRRAQVTELDAGEEIEENVVRIQQETQLIDALNQRINLLEQEEAANRQIAQAERERLELQLQINQASLEQPLIAGFFQAFVESFDDVSNSFQTTLDIMRNAITSFSDFISQSLVDAFDPTSDSSIQERFARFLQDIAKQIIATLVQLAITAAVLNAASGGLLGPFLKSLALSQGFGLAEGGEVGDKYDRHRRRRSRAFRRARGYSTGGQPSERRVPGVVRPTGLAAKDTVAGWLDPREWIIRGSSVAKAGADVMDRINRGHFARDAIRAAVGLSPASRAAVVLGRHNRAGMATGGSATDLRPAAMEATGSGVGFSGTPPVALIAQSEEQMDRWLRQGTPQLMRVLAEQGIFPNG